MEMAHQEERLVQLVIMVFHARHAIMGNGNGANITTNIPASGYVPDKIPVSASIQQNGVQNLVLNLLLRMKMDRKVEHSALIPLKQN